MARQYQDILPVVQQAQQAFGGPNVGESLPTAEEESPYLQQFPEDPELAARGMPDETPLTEADMYQESPALPEEPGAAPVDDLPPEAGPPEPSWRSFARVEDLDEEGNSTGWSYEFDRDGRVKIIEAPPGSRAKGVILTSGRAYDAIVDKTAPILVKNMIRDRKKSEKNAVAQK